MLYENKKLLDSYTIKAKEHRYTMFNPILDYLGNIKEKRVLDIGCGSGELTHELGKRSKQAIGIDLSKERIQHCNNKYANKNTEFLHMNANNLKLLKDNTFDVVIMNMVLPNIHHKNDVKKIFQEIQRVTKKSWDFIFSDLYPLCKMTKEEGNRKQKYSKDFSYFKEGSAFSAIVKLPNKKEIEFIDSHRSLWLYTETLDKNNLRIKKIIESKYPANAPKKFYRYSFPEYIIFCCKKI